MEEQGETGSALSLRWKFSQIFEPKMAKKECEDDPEDVTSDSEDSEDAKSNAPKQTDVISDVNFDRTGDLIATGDCGGRITLYERHDLKNFVECRKTMERMDHNKSTDPKYHLKIDFQSHDTEVDNLTHEKIGTKINRITWCTAPNAASLLLSTNDKTIKLWKVQDKKIKKISTLGLEIPVVTENSVKTNANLSGSPKRAKTWHCGRSYGSLAVSDITQRSKISLSLSLKPPKPDSSTVAMCRRKFANAHDFHINSISTNSDCETFISADELRINLWNLEIPHQTFTIVDFKPANIEHVSEVIRTAECHPVQCNLLAFGTSKGSIRLLDLRQSAVCDGMGKLFCECRGRSSRSVAVGIASAIADIKFKNDGRYMITRDYMTLKLWDINMNSGPVDTYKVHENMLPQIKELYDTKLLVDKFECCLSGDGRYAATGSYSYLFRLFDLCPGSAEARTLQASRTPLMINAGAANPWSTKALKRCGLPVSRRLDSKGHFYYDTMKLLNLAWHPSENLIACAAADTMFLYHA